MPGFCQRGACAILYLAEYPALAAAVVNVRMGGGGESTAAVCRRLRDLGIPFMFYTKFDSAEAASTWPDAPVLNKPAESAKVAETVAGLLPRGAALGSARLQ